MTTTSRIADLYDKARISFIVVTSEMHSQRGAVVVKGTWTAIVRG